MALTQVIGKGLGTLGDGTANDVKIVFDGNAQDFHIGLDDSTDSLTIGLGSALGTTSHMVFDANGHVTKPLQPAFSVYKNADQTNIATESNVITTWQTERFDNNSDFSSNTFTAPVTGKYYLNCHLRLDSVDSASNYYYGGIATSNQFYYTIFDPDFGQDAAYWTHTMNVLADMDAGDTATTIVYQYAGTQQTDISGSTGFTYFSGCLVC